MKRILIFFASLVAAASVVYLFSASKTSKASKVDNPRSSTDVTTPGDTTVFEYDETTGLDTKRTTAFLTANIHRNSGVTYQDSFNVKATSQVDIAGQHIETDTVMEVESETAVQDLAQGGQSVDIVMEHIKMISKAAGILALQCDTNVDLSAAQAECAPFYSLVGLQNHYIIDDEGTIAQASGQGAELVQKMQQDSTVGQLQPSKSLEQTSRLLKFVPSHAVKPGDSWSVVNDMGDMGSFDGKASLIGYKDHHGHDCAVITTQGTLHIDIEKALQAMGGGLADMMQDVHVSDATMTSIMYFDDANDIARWSEATIDMTMTMKNPMDGSVMTLPIHEIVTTSTEIKA